MAHVVRDDLIAFDRKVPAIVFECRRRLQNAVERAVVLSQTPRIGANLLFPSERAEAAAGAFSTSAEIRDRAERHHIRAVLAGAEGRIDETAKLLGVSRSTLFEKMRKLEIRSEA